MKHASFLAPHDRAKEWPNQVAYQTDNIREAFTASEVCKWHHEPAERADGSYAGFYEHYVDECEPLTLTIEVDEGCPWSTLLSIYEDIKSDWLPDNTGDGEDPVWLAVDGTEQPDAHTLKVSCYWAEEEQDLDRVVARRGPMEILPTLLGKSPALDSMIAERLTEQNGC